MKYSLRYCKLKSGQNISLNKMEDIFYRPELLSLRVLIQYDTVINYCRSYMLARSICYDKYLWIRKAQEVLNVPKDILIKQPYLQHKDTLNC